LCIDRGRREPEPQPVRAQWSRACGQYGPTLSRQSTGRSKHDLDKAPQVRAPEASSSGGA
jgi:hypothetical protein